MRHIQINSNSINILSPIDGKIVFTIHDDEFIYYTEAIKRSMKMKKQFERINKKYNGDEL